jgi:hypothetical protein
VGPVDDRCRRPPVPVVRRAVCPALTRNSRESSGIPGVRPCPDPNTWRARRNARRRERARSAAAHGRSALARGLDGPDRRRPVAGRLVR